jgi:hypothetical protein
VPAAAQASLDLIVADARPLEIEARSDAGRLPIARRQRSRDPPLGVPPDLWLETGGPRMLPPHVVRPCGRCGEDEKGP